MKRVSVFLAVLVVATAAMAAEVTSVNVVGYVKKELPADGVILTTVNFTQVGGDANTLTSVFGTDQLKQDANPANCDRITIWDPATQTYQTWAQYTDGVFYKANDAQEWDQSIAGDPEVDAGVGFWVTAGNGGATKDLVLMGQVVDAQTASMDIVGGAQIIGYPLSSSIAMQDTDFANEGAAGSANPANADRITVWLGDAFQTYALYTDGVWYKANDATEWEQSIAADNTLELAEGFWYTAQGAFTWSEDSPYVDNL